jgi:hypothetical protein
LLFNLGLNKISFIISMANCFKKYGVDDLTNFDFTSSDLIQKKKYNNIYCNMRNDKDSNGNYKDRKFTIKDNKLTYVVSNEDHINITKAQYYYYYSNDCSCNFDLYKLEIEQDCDDILPVLDGSNNYTGINLQAITADTTNFAVINDTSLSDVIFSNIDQAIYNKMPKMAFPTKVRFDNAFC